MRKVGIHVGWVAAERSLSNGVALKTKLWVAPAVLPRAQRTHPPSSPLPPYPCLCFCFCPSCSRSTCFSCLPGSLPPPLPCTPACNTLTITAPGEGPSKEVRDNGYFWINYFAKGTSADGTEVVCRGKVGSDKGDSGYKETAKARCSISRDGVPYCCTWKV